jgi:hypothetical protein
VLFSLASSYRVYLCPLFLIGVLSSRYCKLICRGFSSLQNFNAFLLCGYGHIFLNMQAESLRRNEETKVENVSKSIMENDRVRVLQVLFKPNDKTVMHSHPDHVVYVLKGGKLKLTSSGKQRY